jgi:cytochrome d ubiquinol oxidase subunit I
VLSLAAPAQVVVGDWSARTVAKDQPTKLAAIEGLRETTAGADLTVGGLYVDGHVYGGASIPNMLSLLAFHDPDSTVEGLDAVPADDRPPVGWVRNSFQLMVGIGTSLALLGLWFLWARWRRGALPRTPWFYRLVVVAGPASLVALIAGWIVTEVGRQPWIVYELMRVEEAVTGAEGIPVGYATLVVVYLGLISTALYMLRRLARNPPEVEVQPGPGDIEVLP